MSDRRDGLVAAWRAAKALLFDFDGVLAASEPLYRASYNTALAPYGHVIAEDEYWVYWSSKGHGLAGEIARHSLVGVDTAAVEAVQQRAYRVLCEAGHVPLADGAAALLRRLARPDEPAARPLTIASNTARDLVETVLRAGGAPVPPVVGGDGLPLKPAPDIFLRAAADLGVSPTEALVFEDSEKGLRAAAAGGFRAVLVRNPTNRGLALEAPYAFELERLAELQEVMDQI